MEGQEFVKSKEGREQAHDRLKDIVLVVGGAALIFYVGHRMGFSAGRKAGIQFGTMVSKAHILDAMLQLR